MKLKIITLLLLFSICSFSSFAVIDSKERVLTERIQSFPKENFSKKKTIKKRKFRLWDLFQLKKKVRKARKEGKKKVSIFAVISFVLAAIGTAILISGDLSGILLIFLLIVLAAFITGMIGLSRIKQNPERLKGKVLARLGIIISASVALFFIGAILVAILSWDWG